MTTKKILFLVIIGLTSCVICDGGPFGEISNHSNHDVQLRLYFDTSAYKPHWTKHGFRQFITYIYGFSHPGPETTLISSDTLNFTQDVNIPIGSTYVVSTWDQHDSVPLYNKIQFIHNSDTFTLGSLEEIKKAFLKIDKRESRLEIK